MSTEQFTFKAEINELMNMIIHNFYSNKDIFLRELISNASDAINKLKHESLQDKSILNDFYEFLIRIKVDKESKYIMLEDTGIGMSREDLINNLGTIAKSGTKEFIKKLGGSDSTTGSNLIGQFGVGFYSGYLVADNVKVVTRKAGTSNIYEWESSANGSFTLKELEESETDIIRGTRIYLNLKNDSEEYLETSKITEIVKKHSSYITYPILLHSIKTKEVEDTENSVVEDSESKEVENLESKEVEDSQNKESELESEAKLTVEDVVDEDDEDDEEKETIKNNKKMKTIEEESWDKINSEPIWSKSPSEVTEEEYETFYKSLSGDWDKHCSVKHFKAEGNVEFDSILFIPSRAPFDLFDKKPRKNVKLYVKKVLISDECKDLCPDWLNFISGIVDSNDLPLNASRELLQQSKILKQISKHVVKKSIEMINELTDDKEKYKTFYENFDKNLKLGIHEEENSREKLVEFLRYNTSKGSFVSFAEYKDRMKEGQPGIYYITGESIKGLENSPFVDKLKKLDWEIIYMCDPIDEYIIQHLSKYNDIKLINVSKDDLSLPEDTETEKPDFSEYEKLCEKIKTILGEKVDSVKISTKIESQPAIITNPMGMSANMERIMRAQALANKNTNPMMMGMFNKKSMEINPSHNIMRKLKESINDESQNKVFEELVDVVYESALLSSGYQVEDINGYLKKVYSLMN